MRTPQLADNLRRAVLQAAIEGKLNDRTNENARDLLAAIQTEKAALQKTGKQKKSKPLAAISEEEIPFAIPENWVWVRLGDVILQNIGGGTPSKQEPSYWNGKIPWASVKDLNCDVLTKTIDSITTEGLENSSANLIPKGTFIICTRMGLGKIALTDIDVAINQDLRAIFLSKSINKKYFYHFYRTLKMEGKGATVKGITVEELHNIPIPLPPLTEQQQIVAKLNHLLTEIDELKAQEQALLAAQNAFPKKLRAALLQAAVQGELNERTNENARDLFAAIQAEKAALQKAGKLKKDKPLAVISEEEIPFAIPENWVWVRLGEISSKITDGSHNPPPKRVSGIPILSAANIFEQKIQFSSANRWISYEEWEIENKRTSIDPNDVLLTIVGTIGRTAVVEDDTKFALQRSVAVIKPILISSIYLSYLLQSPFLLEIMTLVSKGTAQKGIYLNSLKDLPIPLPPLSEQQQIVAKLETLLAEIDTLENAA